MGSRVHTLQHASSRPRPFASIMVAQHGQHQFAFAPGSRTVTDNRPLQNLHYEMPEQYEELVSQRNPAVTNANAAGAEHEHDSDVPTADDEQRRFWKEVRKVARKRLRALSPDLNSWQRRVATKHEALWLEELRVAWELAQWRVTQEHIPCTNDGLYLINLADLGDSALLTGNDGLSRGLELLIRCNDKQYYRGYVQPRSSGSSLVVSAKDDLAYKKGPFHITFHQHRFPQSAMHHALDAPLLERFMHEEQQEALSISTGATSVDRSSLPNTLNENQCRAVLASVDQSIRRPLLVWGPPGTGKTTLAAFMIWHLVQHRPTDTRVLVAAPSNTGADVLCLKLAKLGLDSKRMLRLNARGRSWQTVPEDIRGFSYSNLAEDGKHRFEIPPASQLKEFKVVVTTCVGAFHISKALRSGGSAAGWFSHVVIDEAGEASEPETLIPLALLRESTGAAVLLGDHFQLGPLVTSPTACKLGELDRSLLERLANERFEAATPQEDHESVLNHDFLDMCEHRGLFFMTESYRSHPAIMALYSKLFYGGQLVHRSRPKHEALMPFFRAKGLAVPVLLHHIEGKERKDRTSPSLYNQDELGIVIDYVAELVKDSTLGLKAEDIGIISPYAKQVSFFKDAFMTLGDKFRGIDVGTVEFFQGQERQLIVISTVRSATADSGNTSTNARSPLGFLADQRRLNVAISRAVAGLLIVGNLRTLASHNAKWRSLVELAMDMDAVRGGPLEIGQSFLKQTSEQERVAVPKEKATAAWEALVDS